MKLKLITAALLTTIITTASFANIQTHNAEGYNIYVYKNCQLIEEIPMTARQLAAYKELSSQELLLEKLEQPIEEMENKLEHYEDAMDDLTDLMFEDGDEIVINKASIKKQKALATKIKGIVNFYEKDIKNIEKQAKAISASAQEFEKIIKPSIKAYEGKDIQINISNKVNNWRCKM